MRRSWITRISWALVCFAAPSPYALAAPAQLSPKTVPKKAKKAKKPAAPRKKAPALPMKPPADIPAVTEAASVWQGCLGARDLPVLASRLGMEEPRLASLLGEEDLFASDGEECVPSVAVTGGEGGVASATFQRATGSSPILALRKTADGVTLTPGACDCPEPARRVLTVPGREISELLNESLLSVPQNVRWQLDILAPQMIGRLPAQGSEAEPGVSNGSAAAEPGYTLRVVLETSADTRTEHLQSLEILDPAANKRLDGVWWLARPDGPGVFIGADGLAYERLLWQSPIKYVQKSRGVGPALTSYRRRVPAPKGSKGPATVVRTFFARGYHLGVDMVAPKGTEIHAVGDATVGFAGRLGGYGNLIILNHGRGYQTYYAHLSRIGKGIQVGVPVAGGEVIGLVGSTGNSTAPHLHFETRKDAKYIDPFDDSRQLEFWLLTADDQERLAMQLLAAAPVVARDGSGANRQEPEVSSESR